MDAGGKEAAASGETRGADPVAWLVDSLKDFAIFTLDDAGRVTSWNTGAQRIVGYPPAAILGQPVACLYTAEDVASALPRRQLEQAATADHIESEEWRGGRGGGGGGGPGPPGPPRGRRRRAGGGGATPTRATTPGRGARRPEKRENGPRAA